MESKFYFVFYFCSTFALTLANQWKGNEGYLCCIVGKMHSHSPSYTDIGAHKESKLDHAFPSPLLSLILT